MINHPKWNAIPADVALVMPRRMRRGHEHLSAPAAVLTNVFGGEGVTTAEVILIAETPADALGGEALLSGKPEVLFEDAVGDAGFPTAAATVPSANPRPPGWSHR
jgi:hypothetical protein